MSDETRCPPEYNLSPQQVFVKSVGGIIAQGRRAKRGNCCQYRIYIDDKVCRCAVGQLIDDREYQPRIEGSSLYDLIWEMGTHVAECAEVYHKINWNRIVDEVDGRSFDPLLTVMVRHDVENLLSDEEVRFYYLMRQLAVDYRLLNELQHWHDSRLGNKRDDLRRIADEHELELDPDFVERISNDWWR